MSVCRRTACRSCTTIRRSIGPPRRLGRWRHERLLDLARVDAGYRFAGSGDFPFRQQGVGIPSLGEVLRKYPDVPVIIDMKVDSREMGEAVAREVRAAGAADRACAAGYGARSAAAARAALSDMACSASRPEARLAVYRAWVRWPVRRAPYGGYQVPERTSLLRIVSQRFIQYAHETEVKVHVWTVDEEADMRRLLAWGVDGLISNRPDLATPGARRVLPMKPRVQGFGSGAVTGPAADGPS